MPRTRRNPPKRTVRASRPLLAGLWPPRPRPGNAPRPSHPTSRVRRPFRHLACGLRLSPFRKPRSGPSRRLHPSSRSGRRPTRHRPSPHASRRDLLPISSQLLRHASLISSRRRPHASRIRNRRRLLHRALRSDPPRISSPLPRQGPRNARRNGPRLTPNPRPRRARRNGPPLTPNPRPRRARRNGLRLTPNPRPRRVRRNGPFLRPRRNLAPNPGLRPLRGVRSHRRHHHARTLSPPRASSLRRRPTETENPTIETKSPSRGFLVHKHQGRSKAREAGGRP